MKHLIIACIFLSSATVFANQFTWSPEPPNTPGSSSFWFGATLSSEDEYESLTITLYRNGVYLASDTQDGYVYVDAYTSADLHTTYVAASEYDGQLIKVVNPDTSPPSTPTNLAASSQTSTSFTLTWTASTDNGTVAGYEVKRDSTSLGTAAGNSRNITGLTPNVTYQFSVRSQDAAGNWSVNWSTALPVTLVDVTAPTTPTLSLSSKTHLEVNLGWTASTDDIALAGYDIYRTKSGVTNLVGTTNSSTLSYADTHVWPGTAYVYVVKARDTSGNLATSGELNVTTDAVPGAAGDNVPNDLDALFGLSSEPTADSALTLQIQKPNP